MKAFFEKYSGVTHALAGFWAFLVAAYAANAGGFRDIVNGDAVALYHSLPANAAKAVYSLFALAVPLWAFYRNGQKGTTVEATLLPGESGVASIGGVALKEASSGSADSGALKSIALFLVLTLLLGSTAGCTASQVEADVNAVLTQATNVLVVADPGAPWIPQLQAAITALKTAEASYSAGTSTQAVVVDALNTIEAITAVIPVTAAYSPLIDVLVAGIETALALLLPTAAAAGTSTTLSANMRQAVNPHAGRVTIKHHFLHSRTAEFKAAWNQAAAANPGLAGATIQ